MSRVVVIAGGALALGVGMLLAIVTGASHEARVWGMLALQALGVAWLIAFGLSPGRGWATATTVLGIAWIPLFLVPSLVFAVAPNKLPQGSLLTTLTALDVAVFAMVAGASMIRRRWCALSPVRASAGRFSTRRAVIWFSCGFVALLVLFANAGGPVAYVSHLQDTGAQNASLTYLIWLVMAMRYAPLAMMAADWQAGRPARRPAVVAFAVGMVFIGLVGARLFLAFGLVELLLAYTLMRRPIRLTRLAVIAVPLAIVLVFGLGTLRRYQSYHATHPGEGVGAYVTEIAPAELSDAYVNNYVDTVSLTSRALATVPSDAPYEGPRVIVATLLQPIPGLLRPALPRNSVIKARFEPAGGFTYAIPLVAITQLAAGAIGIVAVFAVLGFLVRMLDLRSERICLTFAGTLGLVGLIGGLPAVLRGGLPVGLVVVLLEMVGLWVVGRSCWLSEPVELQSLPTDEPTFTVP